jgi:FAD/FMN-containing dehydrogenase/Fe-S oxidoreductase
MSAATPVGDTETLESALRARVDGEIRFDAGSRAAYSTDSSNYRQVPIGVVVPRTVEAAVEAVSVCRTHDVPVLSRGGGTSLAGQCTNAAVVIDWTKYCHALVSVDADNRTCVVEPGIILDQLNDRLAPYGLRYGPEPATHMNCSLGGMIGNNSCGTTAQRTGKVVDNIARLEVLLYDGTRFWCGETSDAEYAEIERRGDKVAAIYRSLRRIRDTYGDDIRAAYPEIPRRVSGYNLDSLLTEHHFDVAGALVGSESTLVTVLRAELELVPVLEARTLVVLGYPDIAAAADAVPRILPHEPVALEGVDHRLIHDEQVKHMNSRALDELPEGTGYLLVQFGGDSQEETDRAGRALIDDLAGTEHEPHHSFFDDPATEDELWQVRESGLGATAHLPGKPDTWPGWEDSAVHPDRLGDYLRDLDRLYQEFGYGSESGPALYGHFGQACVHTRIPFDLTSAEGVHTYRKFMERAADLAVSYDGSFSGEHGDGQARGELLPKMFGDRVMSAFGELKAVFDPTNRMNPGKVVAPARMDQHLRLGGDWAPTPPQDLYFAYPEDDGSFNRATTRCVGVGRCRQHNHDGHDVMCPSYQVTGEEEHSTRGRARLLFEMMNGHGDSPIEDRWRSTAVRDSLDLCLACKGCKSDCPADVDMATYKAEFLAHHYRGRLRPRDHYAMGWLPLAARVVGSARAARWVNRASHAPGLRRVLLALGHLEDREVPVFAHETLQQWWARRPPGRQGGRGTLLLWPDTFTNNFQPEIGKAAVEVLEDAGWSVTIPTSPLCCGLTWISTGQLDVARRVLRRTVDELAEHVRAGGLVVGLEPSCTAVFRSDASDLMPDDLDVRRLREQTFTLAEVLMDKSPGWTPPPLAASWRHAMAQVHCHQHAVMGWDADSRLLEAAGLDAEHLASGCCGLAGNFGFTKGHGEVSEACAEQVLLPRLREAGRETVMLADGFSCRTQIHDLDSGGREGIHLAELLAGAGRAAHRPGRSPEEELADRTPAPSPAGSAAMLLAAATTAASGLWWMARRRRTR